MAVFFVNGTEVSVEKNQRLLRYLRACQGRRKGGAEINEIITSDYHYNGAGE